MMPATARMPHARRRAQLASGKKYMSEQVVAPTQHLAAGQQRAVVDELAPSQRRFQRPDPFLQPALERQVVADAAQQIHRGVGVGVDQARDQQVVRQGVLALRDTAARGLDRRPDADDQAAAMATA